MYPFRLPPLFRRYEMKKYIIILITLACFAVMVKANLTYDQANYKKHRGALHSAGTNDPLYNFIGEVNDIASGTQGVAFLLYTPTTAPATAAKGQLYFDLASSNFKYYTTSWQTVAASTSSTLDEAYDAGTTIDVDGDVITFTASDTDDNAVLRLVQNDGTNDPNCLELIMGTGSTGNALKIEGQTGGTDITATNFSVTTAGVVTCVGVTSTGEIQTTADILMNATYDIAFDASKNQLIFQDNAILGIGGAHDAAPDMTFKSDATNVLVEVATQDAADLIFGSTNALDILIYNDAADSIITFDNSAEMAEFNGWDIRLQDGDFLCLGDTSDWTLGSPSAKKAKFTPATGDGTDSLDIGANTAGGDFQLFGANTSGAYALWDSDKDAWWLDKADIAFSESDGLLFGDTLGTGDIRIDSASAVLTIDQVADGTGTVAFGADGNSIDVTFYGLTSGARFLFDESADQLVGVGGAQITLNDDVEMLFGTGTSNAGDFKIYGSGTGPKLIIDVISAASGSIEIGNDADDVPLTWFGETTACYFKLTGDQLQAEGSTIALGDGDNILFGDTLGTGIFSIGEASNALVITQVTEGAAIQIDFGVDANGVDTKWYGDTASSFMLWDEDYGTNGALDFDVVNLHIGDGDELQFGDLANDGDFTISDEGDVWTFAQGTADTGTVTWGADNAGMDITWYGESASAYMKWDATSADQLLITGVDSSGTILVLTGVDTTGDSDTVTLAHSGAGDGVQVTLGSTDSTALRIIACASQVTPSVVIDANTNNWDGADNVGMLHLVADDPLIHAGATLLYVANSGTPIASAEGFCARFLDTSSARSGTYVMEIESTNNEALHVDSGKVLVDETLTATLGVQVGVGETLTANTDDGAGSQIDDDITFANVTAVNAGVNDYVVLPNEPTVGTVVYVAANAASNFEIRTLEAGNDSINGVDCSDGGTEYLATNTDLIKFTCHKADQWIGESLQADGTHRAAVTPD